MTSRLTLGLLLALAFSLRVMWWSVYVRVLENEGVAYARLAQSLFAGEGMIGIFGGRDVMLPPLFPALIGLFSMVTGSEELAGRVIGLLCGTALVWVLHALTARVFGARAALYVAVMAAVHPLLVALSVSVYSEGPWIFLIVCAAYLIVCSYSAASDKPLLAAGMCTGFAYLIRPEAMAFIAYFGAMLLVAGVFQRRKPVATARSMGVFLATSLMIALPYIVHLSWLAGSFRWEGKSSYNNVQNELIREGMTIAQATRGLNSDGNPVGVFLSLHVDQVPQLRQSSASTDSLLRTLTADSFTRTRRIVHTALTAGFISAPWIFVLAVGGVTATLWWRSRVWEGLTLLGISSLQGLLLLSVDQLWNRYFFTLTPLLLVWAGVGLEWMTTWVSRYLGTSLPNTERLIRYGICLLGCAALSLAAFRDVRAVQELEQAGDRVSKEIGQSIAADARSRAVSGRPIVMGITLTSAYYAGATLRYLPYAAEDAALAYVHRMQPHYLVVRGFEAREIPYGSSWLQQGIPDSCAVLLREKWTVSSDESRVWRWSCDATPFPNARLLVGPSVPRLPRRTPALQRRSTAAPPNHSASF